MDGDAEATYAYYLFHKNNILPSEFMNMDLQEKALLMAMVDILKEDEKKEERKLKSKRRR